MKFRITKSLESHLVKTRVPTIYKELAENCESQLKKTCTLVVFPHDRKSVVKSTLVEKAIKKLGDEINDSLVVVGGCFSSEAIALLKSRNAIFLSLSEFPWTDSSHNRIHSGKPKY